MKSRFNFPLEHTTKQLPRTSIAASSASWLSRTVLRFCRSLDLAIVQIACYCISGTIIPESTVPLYGSFVPMVKG